MTKFLKEISSENLLLGFMSVLVLAVFGYLFTFSFHDYKHLEKIEQYRLPKEFMHTYKIFDYDQKESIIAQIKSKSLDDRGWQKSTLPTQTWSQNFTGPDRWIVYRFKFDVDKKAPKQKLYAFAPTTIQHSEVQIFANGMEISDYPEFENDKHVYIVPLMQHDGGADQHVVSILAKLDKNANGLIPTLGYFYGPYDAFPRLNYYFLNLVLFSRGIALVGAIVTILLILVVYLIPSQRFLFNLFFYSLFYNLLAVAPASFARIDNYQSLYLMMAISQAIGLLFWGLFILRIAQLNRNWIAKAGICVIAGAFVATQIVFVIANDYHFYLRLLFAGIMATFAIFTLVQSRKKTKNLTAQHKGILILTIVLFGADLFESMIWHHPYYDRYLIFHITYVIGILVLVFLTSKNSEKKVTELQGVSQQMGLFSQSFQMFTHDLMGPFNKVEILTKLLGVDQKKGVNSKFAGRISGFADEINRERNYVSSMIKELEEIYEERDANFESFELLEVFNEETLNLYPNLCTIFTKFDFVGEEIRIFSDRNKIIRILRNLIKNALKATNGDTEITVQCIKKSDQIEIRCRNTGSTISKEAAENIFKPFYTTSKTNKGLGLFICRSLTMRLGGELKLESGEDFVEFSIVLPKK